MPETISPHVERALEDFEAAAAGLPEPQRAAVREAVADLLGALLIPPVFAVDRRPEPTARATNEQIQTVVNRLRDRGRPDEDQGEERDEKQPGGKQPGEKA